MKQPLFKKTNLHRRVSTGYIGTVQVTNENMERLADFRRTFRQVTGKNLHLWGRNPNRKQIAAQNGLCHKSLSQNLPVKFATSFDVYFR